MKTREFNISYNVNLDIYAIEDYIYEDLEVPKEYLESLKISDEYVNIKLSPTRKYFNDDWYVNLQRVG